MLMKLPSNASVPPSSPDCAIKADEANQVQGGSGLQLVWTVAPTSQFLHEAAATRVLRPEPFSSTS